MSFSVQYSQDLEGDDPPDRNFFVYEDAMVFAEEKLQRFKAVWISETGRDRLLGREDWYYFWWSPAVAQAHDIGSPKGRGQGYRGSRWNELFEYEPIRDLKEYL